MTLINRNSFVSTGTETKTYTSKRGEWTTTYENGAVEVTLQRRTKMLPAKRYPNGDIYVHDVTGRYVQGGKVWPAMICSYGETRRGEHVNFGRDDRSGRFNKANGLFFA